MRVVQVVAVLQAAGAAAVDDRHAVDHDQAVAGAAAVDDQVHAGFGNRPADVLRHAGDEHAGVIAAKLTKLRSVGSASITSRDAVLFCTTFCTSTIGLSPVTVIVSSTVPTFMSALTFAVNAVVSSIPSRLTVLKPVSVNVTV